MEKYIFDCRQKLNEYPKYLKRNHKVSHLPTIEEDQHVGCEYLKNKIFLTFDYSYYQNIPKTASMYVGNRINNLNTLIAQDELPQTHKSREGCTSALQCSKWRKEKENSHFSALPNQPNRDSAHRERKKIKLPVNSMPCVGDYYFEPEKIRKRIIYDVKIRGKPRDHRANLRPLQPRVQNCSPVPAEGKKEKDRRVSRSSKSANGCNTRQPRTEKKRPTDQQYTKFVKSIQISNVWRKLMQKHKLKGSKFDIYGYDQ